jgi:hypothetical protein
MTYWTAIGQRGARWLAALVCAVVFSLSGSAHGQESADDLARRHFESGRAYLQESDNDNALKAFQKAYELSKRPAILLNIATVEERMGHLNAAIDTLQRYLKEEPKGEHVDTVRLRISNLQKRLSEQPAPTPAASTPTAEQPALAKPPPAAGHPAAPPPPEQNTSAPAPKIESRPNRIPAYVLVGLGGASTVGAVVTGVLANAQYNDKKSSCSPNCTDSELKSGRTLALTSTILTVVAVAAGGTGIVLLLTGQPRTTEELSALRRHRSQGSTGAMLPEVHVAADATGAAAQATWRF